MYLETTTNLFKRLAASQPIGGLSYIIPCFETFHNFSVQELVIDTLLTQRAAEIESSTGHGWKPIVLRRVDNSGE